MTLIVAAPFVSTAGTEWTLNCMFALNLMAMGLETLGLTVCSLAADSLARFCTTFIPT